VTILFSTSYLDEAERCSRVGLIYEGDLLIADTPSAAKARIGGKILELRIENRQKGMKVLEGVKVIRSLVLSGDKIHLLVDDSEKGEKAVREVLKEQRIEIQDLVAARPTLEDVFVSIVQKKQRNNAEL